MAGFQPGVSESRVCALNRCLLLPGVGRGLNPILGAALENQTSRPSSPWSLSPFPWPWPPHCLLLVRASCACPSLLPEALHLQNEEPRSLLLTSCRNLGMVSSRCCGCCSPGQCWWAGQGHVPDSWQDLFPVLLLQLCRQSPFHTGLR